MADSVVGALRVLLGLDSAAFSSGLKDANSQVSNFAVGFKKFAAQISIAAAATKFAYDVKGMIDKADEFEKASQKFGVPVETLSSLNYAADLANVSFEGLSKGLGKLSKAMFEGAVNPGGDVAKVFKSIGVAVTDAGGNVKSTDTVFKDIAQRFSTMEDGAAKTALAIKIFGKAGADLIPLLNQGRTGIQAMQDEAKKLGIVIDSETAVKAEQFNDTLKRIHATTDALVLRTMAGLLPALQQLADMFLSAKQNGSVLQGILDNLITQGDIDQLRYYIVVWENLGRILNAIRDFGKTAFTEGLQAGFDLLNKAVLENQKNLDAYARSLLSLGQAGAFESMDNLTAILAKVAQGVTKVNTSVLAAKSALDSFIESQAKSIAGHQAEAAAIGQGLGVKERLKIYLEAEAIAREHNVTVTEAQKVKLNELAAAAEKAAIDVAAAQLKQDALSPWDLYLQKLRDINTVLREHPELADQAAQASMKAAAGMAEAYGSAMAGAMGNFADFFKTFAKGNKEMFLIGKAFSISQAIINTFVGATKALATLPPPFGEIAAAGVIAAGLAQVAKIVAEKPPAMALGGSFAVSGAGGVDSKMVPIMATPGERISVDQNKYGDTGGGVVTVQGIKAKDYYRGDVLRDFVDNLNEAIGDGLKIKMA